MLEEGLRSPTYSPAEAAQALHSFIQIELQGGGANSEKRFIGLFSLLCDRLFGKMAGPKDNYRHEIGGWLSRQNQWQLQPKSSFHETYPIESDPVFQLLCGKESSQKRLVTFIEAIEGTTETRRGVRIQFPFRALPKPTQEFVLQLIQNLTSMDPMQSPVHSLERSNALRLFNVLLRVRPKDQVSIRGINQAEKVDSSKPLRFSAGSLPLSPSQGTSSFDSTPKKKDHDMPQIMLNMVEYFIFTFIRYPLAPPVPATPAPQGIPANKNDQYASAYRQTRSRGRTYGERMYRRLFCCYLQHFVNTGEYKREYLGFPTLSRESELFLRTVAEFWLCGNMKFTTTSKSIEGIKERRQKIGLNADTFDLDSAFEMVKVKYESPSPQVQKCIRSLVPHLLKNSDLPLAVKDCYRTARSANHGERHGQVPWCLSPSMDVLQQTFYNYLSATFRHAPIHMDGSPFYVAFDSWLHWLEPWNVEWSKFVLCIGPIAVDFDTHKHSIKGERMYQPCRT